MLRRCRPVGVPKVKGGELVVNFGCLQTFVLPIPVVPDPVGAGKTEDEKQHVKPSTSTSSTTPASVLATATPDPAFAPTASLASPTVLTPPVPISPDPTPSITRNMAGEIEIRVTEDRRHRFFPGHRTIVRFRLVG